MRYATSFATMSLSRYTPSPLVDFAIQIRSEGINDTNPRAIAASSGVGTHAGFCLGLVSEFLSYCLGAPAQTRPSRCLLVHHRLYTACLTSYWSYPGVFELFWGLPPGSTTVSQGARCCLLCPTAFVCDLSSLARAVG